MNKNINEEGLVPEERVEQKILIIRGQKVILDSDLAALYGVEVKRLNEAVKRNIERFPAEFMFQLTREEADQLLRSQIATLRSAHGAHRKYLPYAFTEHGALMAATVLNSPQAVAMSLAIIKTFVKLRQILSVNKDLSYRLDELEKKYDEHFQIIFAVIMRLEQKTEEPETKITGFHG